MDDFREISARFKKSHDADDESTQPQVVDHAESYRIRAKMIGVLLLDARVKAGRSLNDCATILRTSAEQIERWEFGTEAPSLPQLELLAFYLDVPVSHSHNITKFHFRVGKAFDRHSVVYGIVEIFG